MSDDEYDIIVEPLSDLYDHEQEVAGLALAAAEIVRDMIALAEQEGEEGDVIYLNNVKTTLLDIADSFSPPGEPDEGWSGEVVSLDRWIARRKDR